MNIERKCSFKGGRLLPKKLDVSKDKILDITDSILQNDGYRAVSVRRVAELCGMATGTLYLYFDSKDTLIARTVVRKWKAALDKMTEVIASTPDFCEGIVSFYLIADDFLNTYRSVFNEFSRSVGSHDALTSKHILLREQLSERISALAEKTGQTRLLPHSDMLTECLLAALNQKDMDENTLKAFVSIIVN